MLALHYQKKTLIIPENWNELTGRQVVELTDLLRTERSRLQSQIAALQILSGRSKLMFFMLKPEYKDAFLPYADWVFGDNTLTSQLLPMYDDLYGPGSEFCNLRMKEFHFSEMYYKNYTEEKSEEDLNLLIATLYRPAKFPPQKGVVVSDIRVPFDAANTAHYAKRVGEWPLALRLAILFYYDGCRQQLVALYDKVFDGQSEVADDEKAQYGLYGLMMELAGEKLGTVHQVEDMYVHGAFASLELMIIKAEEIEAQMPKA